MPLDIGEMQELAELENGDNYEVKGGVLHLFKCFKAWEI